MAGPFSTPPLSFSYTPGCPNLLHKQPCLVSSRLSILELYEIFNDFISKDCPWRNCLWDSSCFCPYYSSLCVLGVLCICSGHLCPPTLPQLWCYCTKKTPLLPASLAPLMCHGQTRLLCSHFSLLSLSLSSTLSLWAFLSLLDGAEAEPQTNFSHSCNEAWLAQFVSLRGNRIHSSVLRKTPFFQT